MKHASMYVALVGAGTVSASSDTFLAPTMNVNANADSAPVTASETMIQASNSMAAATSGKEVTKSVFCYFFWPLDTKHVLWNPHCQLKTTICTLFGGFIGFSEGSGKSKCAQCAKTFGGSVAGFLFGLGVWNYLFGEFL